MHVRTRNDVEKMNSFHADRRVLLPATSTGISWSDLFQELAARTLCSQFFVAASFPSAHKCFGCWRPWPSHKDISQPIDL